VFYLLEGSEYSFTLQLRERRDDPLLYFCNLFLAGILAARPEKTFQTILFSSRRDVNVQMRNALADAIIHCHESALGSHRNLNCPRKELNI